MSMVEDNRFEPADPEAHLDNFPVDGQGQPGRLHTITDYGDKMELDRLEPGPEGYHRYKGGRPKSTNFGVL